MSRSFNGIFGVSGRVTSWRVRWGVALALCWVCVGVSVGDELLMRNLDVLSGRVERFNLDGVEFAEENSAVRLIDWGAIQSGRLGLQQDDFDRVLKRVGDGLYRIAYRSRIGAEKDLLAPAEALSEVYAGRESLAAYRVSLALMRGRLAAGSRAAAVGPYLRCLVLSEALGKRVVAQVKGRSLLYDPKTGLSIELLPVWEDEVAAGEALVEVGGLLKALGDRREPGESGGGVIDGVVENATRLYAASLAVAVGEGVAARRHLNSIRSGDGALGVFKGLLELQLAAIEGDAGVDPDRVVALEAGLSGFDPGMQAVGRYWLGRALLERKEGDLLERRKGMIHLLHLPAVYGESSPTLAAEALYRVSGGLAEEGRDSEARVLRRELLNRYPSSRWAARAGAR